MDVFVGLLRDLVAAVLALAILFGASFSDSQVAGIIQLVAVVAALGTWAYSQYKASHPTAAGRPGV